MKFQIKTITAGAAALGFVATMSAAVAEEGGAGQDGQVPLTAGKPYVHVIHNDQSVKVERVQDPGFELRGYWAKTVRDCPPFCLQPMEAAPGVATVGEVEVFEFMENQMRDGTGILIDARTPNWHEKGTIPGSVNIPFTVFKNEPDSIEVSEALELFGAVPNDGDSESVVDRAMQKLGLAPAPATTEYWDFTNAREIMLWCNGAYCGQSPRAIEGLISLGYPREKILYFRGGMQAWQLWGLSTVVPEEQDKSVQMSSVSVQADN